MNKAQTKIFINKILPKIIILSFLIIGFILFIGTKIYYNVYVEPEINSPEFKQDVERFVKEQRKEELTKKETKYINCNKLNIPIDNWNIEKQFTYPDNEDEAGGLILSDEALQHVVFFSYTIHRYITNLHEYSEHANERTIRNMKPTGIILKSKNKKDIKFNGVDAVQETFESNYKPTNEVSEFISLNFKYKGLFYTIGYTQEPKSNLMISNIQFIE
jgi:hypothetical protein